jgi:hypothetical protein
MLFSTPHNVPPYITFFGDMKAKRVGEKGIFEKE